MPCKMFCIVCIAFSLLGMILEHSIGRILIYRGGAFMNESLIGMHFTRVVLGEGGTGAESIFV